ncbi:carbohydrate esterase family 16 protein [Viridothelium virens]|uniref:Carbohydrate esterase family 16 protein n=1 Tax=Viridothelium virens TaxID=1048519 RepID=A0A6A6HMZ6_VIRVR|nr:carbohydrate esterase family 16 protein [Viridothelium virens]
MEALKIASILLLYGVFSAALPTSSKPTFNWTDTQSLITFGDSYTYVQGIDGYANSTFIGSRLDFAFNASELLSNRIVQNQTATAEGGPNWVEYLTGCALKPGLTAPITCRPQLWDFAFGGSDISEQYTPLHHNWTVSFVNQIKQFSDYAQPVLSKFLNPREALIGVWIGINDIGDSDKYNITKPNFPGFPSFYNTIQTTEYAAVQQLHDRFGYRNFVFFTLPPLDRTPGNVASSAPNPNATMVGWYNSGLASHTAAFAAANPDSNVMLFDAHAVLGRILDAPAGYGIRNTTGYCPEYNAPDILTDPEKYGCLPQEEYFWFNTGHLTSHVHRILAGELEEFLVGQGK